MADAGDCLSCTSIGGIFTLTREAGDTACCYSYRKEAAPGFEITACVNNILPEGTEGCCEDDTYLLWVQHHKFSNEDNCDPEVVGIGINSDNYWCVGSETPFDCLNLNETLSHCDVIYYEHLGVEYPGGCDGSGTTVTVTS